jgi:phosphate transport system substrate-binding protein
MNSKSKKIKNLLYAILGLILCVFIFSQVPRQEIYIGKVSPKRDCQKQGDLTICQQIADVPNIPQLQIVPFSGSTTFATLNTEKNIDYIKKQTQSKFVLKYIKSDNAGSGTGIKMLINGTGSLAFAQSSRPIKDTEFQVAEKKNFKLKEIPVANDFIAVYVNPQLTDKVKGLTLQDLQGIFTGKLVNWNQIGVGGPNIAITPYSRRLESSGTVDFFQENVLEGADFGSNVQYENDPTNCIRKVATTPGGISYISVAEANQQTIRVIPIATGANSPFISPCSDTGCKSINKELISNNSYPEELKRRIFVVIKEGVSLDEQAGIAYANILLSDEGQKKLVEEAGFIPLRNIP